jgi:hypothetical protein
MGGSAPRTTIAASTWGTNARVASVFPVRIDPIPGVSTRQRPDDSNGLGTNTSTASTPILFSELFSSETYAGSSPASTSRQAPGRKQTRARSVSPNRSTVGTDVTGTTPTGRISRPTRAFRRVDFPRLNWPTHAT